MKKSRILLAAAGLAAVGCALQVKPADQVVATPDGPADILVILPTDLPLKDWLTGYHVTLQSFAHPDLVGRLEGSTIRISAVPPAHYVLTLELGTLNNGKALFEPLVVGDTPYVLDSSDFKGHGAEVKINAAVRLTDAGKAAGAIKDPMADAPPPTTVTPATPAVLPSPLAPGAAAVPAATAAPASTAVPSSTVTGADSGTLTASTVDATGLPTDVSSLLDAALQAYNDANAKANDPATPAAVRTVEACSTLAIARSRLSRASIAATQAGVAGSAEFGRQYDDLLGKIATARSALGCP